MRFPAVEEGRFLPVGSDVEATSSFQLIAGTNRDLVVETAEGRFRDDLFARLNLWTFHLPGLADRREDIEPNLDYELEKFAKDSDERVQFNREARERYLSFATSPVAKWGGNFRDLSASVTRLATLSPSGRIDQATVDAEIERLQRLWSSIGTDAIDDDVADLLPDELDEFDRAQLVEVIRVCRSSRSLSEAGRALFAVSRTKRKSTNDADRLRKYLARFDLGWEDVQTER